MFNRKLKERIKELEADLSNERYNCKKLEKELKGVNEKLSDIKKEVHSILNIKQDKTLGIFEPYLKLVGLNVKNGYLCYTVKNNYSWCGYDNGNEYKQINFDPSVGEFIESENCFIHCNEEDKMYDFTVNVVCVN